MDDLGNILYILAMLAALVFSAFKKQKQAKKQMPMPEDQEPTHHPMDEDDIVTELKELFQQTKSERPKPVVKQQEVKSKPADLRTFNKEPKKSKPAPVTSPIFMQEEELETESVFDKEQLDLRQAVIYSEILKRPYE